MFHIIFHCILFKLFIVLFTHEKSLSFLYPIVIYFIKFSTFNLYYLYSNTNKLQAKILVSHAPSFTLQDFPDAYQPGIFQTAIVHFLCINS